MKPDELLALQARIQPLLDDPEHAGHPLREVLGEVWQLLEEHVERLERLTHLSDSFQAMARDRERGMGQRYERQLRRINRVVRISDHYQRMLRDLNAQLEEASYRDMLTGVDNRRALMSRLQQEVQRSHRQSTGFVVAMVDIDRFKQINDAYGHEIGDLALTEVARTLGADLREYDACGRWGGEEFLLLLPFTSLADAHGILQRKLEAIRGLEIPGLALTGQHLSISAGLAEHRPGEPLTLTLSRADGALYDAKRQGRDRIACASDPY